MAVRKKQSKKSPKAKTSTKAKASAMTKPAARKRAALSAGPALTPGGIIQLGLGFWGSKTLLTAIELGLFTELGKGPLEANALRQRLGLHERSARDFFDALVALGMLTRK